MEYPAQEEMNVQPCLPAEAERQTIFTGLEDKQLRFFKISYSRHSGSGLRFH